MSDYRVSALRCPGCASTLDEIGAGAALVDVCRQCRGIYLDWFDGEPRELVAEMVTPLAVGEVGDEPKALKGPCPRCAVPMHTELFEGRGPWLHRCKGCQGLFLDYTAAELLASTRGAGSTPPPAPDAPLDRLAAAIRSLLFG